MASTAEHFLFKCAMLTPSNSGTKTAFVRSRRKDFSKINAFGIFQCSGIPSIQFTCNQPANNPQPTSTFTATATRIAGVATGAAGASQGTGSATTSAAGNSAPTAGSTGTTESTGTGGSSSGNATSAGSSGLSTSDRIAIGVGLGVGIPTIVITLAAWLCPCAGRR